jgi:hypothetical protein
MAFPTWVVESWNASVQKAGLIPVLAALFTIITALAYGCWRIGQPVARWFRETIWTPIRDARTRVPKRTLVILPGDRRATYWADAHAAGNQPIMQFHLVLHVSNISKVPVQLSTAWLHYRRWGFTRSSSEGDILVREYGQFEKYPILPGHMSEALGSWMISPPFQKPKKPVTVRVRIIDQFGNSQWTKRLKVYFIDDPRHLY